MRRVPDAVIGVLQFVLQLLCDAVHPAEEFHVVLVERLVAEVEVVVVAESQHTHGGIKCLAES